MGGGGSGGGYLGWRVAIVVLVVVVGGMGGCGGSGRLRGCGEPRVFVCGREGASDLRWDLTLVLQGLYLLLCFTALEYESTQQVFSR